MPDAPPPQADTGRMRALLHEGGPQAGWGSLGHWPAVSAQPTQATPSYAAACAALADQIAQAAAWPPGAHVLSLGCGAGDELLHWVRHWQAGQVVGIEADAPLAQVARQRVAAQGAQARIRVMTGSAVAPGPAGPSALADLPAGRFDAVVCVDAAYHLSPRSGFLAGAWQALRPGGRLAYTDLVLTRSAPPGIGLRWAARACGVDLRELLPLPGQVRRLQQAGFEAVGTHPLDDAVLGGFARFVQRQRAVLGHRAWHPAWWRPALTARLIPPCRAAGLGYALLVATKPEAAPSR